MSEKDAMPASPEAARGERRARSLLWAALFSAFFYSEARTAGDVANLALSPIDLVRGIGPVVLLVAGWLAARPRIKRSIGAVEIGTAMFLFVCIASAKWSDQPFATLAKSVQLAACYLALRRLAGFYESRDDVAKALATVVHVVLLLAAVQYVLNPGMVMVADGPIGVSGVPTGTPRLRSVLPQVSANPLALVAVAGLLALLLRVGPKRLVDHSLAPLVLMPLYLWILLATRTRVALAIGLILVACAILSQAARRPALATMSTLGAAAIVLAAWTPQRLAQVEEFLIRGQDARGLRTLTGRTEFWNLALDSWREHDWVLGQGFYIGHRVGLGLPPSQSNIDSTWIELLVDVGVLGTVPLAIAVLVGALRVFRQVDTRGAGLWLGAVLTYGLVVSFVNPTLQSPGLVLILMGLPLLTSPAVPDVAVHRRPLAGSLVRPMQGGEQVRRRPARRGW